MDMTGTLAPLQVEPGAQTRAPHALHPLLRALFALIIAIVTFQTLLWLYTRHNQQPMRYHPDERGKGEQVIEDSRNWHHPTMLLDTTATAVRWFKVDDSETENVVIAGRWVSAAFAAIFVVAVSFIGYIEAGWWGMLLVALIAGLSPSVQAHAHYLKEDTALLAGL